MLPDRRLDRIFSRLEHDVDMGQHPQPSEELYECCDRLDEQAAEPVY